MFDMLALAFQTDSTRIATLMLAHDGSNRRIRRSASRAGITICRITKATTENLEMIAQIDKFHMKYFGQFLDKLAAAEGRRRQLRSCTIR